MLHQFLTPLHDVAFRTVHGNNLIYNACWEDPRIDRQLLQLDSHSQVVMLTSAGCNVLDYLLDAPAIIHAVDVNPRQNALLELKLALVRQSAFDDLFGMFGRGSHRAARDLLRSVQGALSPFAQEWWWEKIGWFDGSTRRGSFYFCGAAGTVAWIFHRYFLYVRRQVGRALLALFSAVSLDQQRMLFDLIEPWLWDGFSRWLLKQPALMYMLGVPRAQIHLMIESAGDVLDYIRAKVRHVLTQISVRDNYFWRVYLTGSYTEECCPNFLKRENFAFLRSQIDRVALHSTTMSGFLAQNPGSYSHFVLLDHQDWLAWHQPAELQHEWKMILANSHPGTKILMRSASQQLDFLPQFVQKSVRFVPDLTEPLHQQDRVGTYGSLHLAMVQ